MTGIIMLKVKYGDNNNKRLKDKEKPLKYRKHNEADLTQSIGEIEHYDKTNRKVMLPGY